MCHNSFLSFPKLSSSLLPRFPSQGEPPLSTQSCGQATPSLPSLPTAQWQPPLSFRSVLLVWLRCPPLLLDLAPTSTLASHPLLCPLLSLSSWPQRGSLDTQSRPRPLLAHGTSRGDSPSPLNKRLSLVFEPLWDFLPSTPREQGASQVALVVKNLLPMQEMRETWVRFLDQEDPLE